MTNLLICGSRYDITKPMVKVVNNAVTRALANDWIIIAGDAIGIDQFIAEAVRRAHPEHIRLFVYGIGLAPRHGIEADCIHYVDIRKLAFKPLTWQDRDCYMVRQAHKVFAVWNGESIGTQNTFQYAFRQGHVLGDSVWVFGRDGKMINDVE